MNSTPSPPEPGGPVALPIHGTTVTAEDLKARLLAAVQAGGPIRVDAGVVESVGQAVLQLLLAARREAQAGGFAFEIVNPSPAFAERITECCLNQALGLDMPQESLS